MVSPTSRAKARIQTPRMSKHSKAMGKSKEKMWLGGMKVWLLAKALVGPKSRPRQNSRWFSVRLRRVTWGENGGWVTFEFM